MTAVRVQTLDAVLRNRLFAESDILLLMVQSLDARGGGAEETCFRVSHVLLPQNECVH